MKPEEKNRIVHEKIMGLCWHEWKMPENRTDFMATGRVKCEKCNQQAPFGMENEYDAPDYYHSIADAFRVVEKMRTNRWFFQLRADCDTVYPLIVSFAKGTQKLTGGGNSPSAAIVDAALEAIGEKP